MSHGLIAVISHSRSSENCYVQDNCM